MKSSRHDPTKIEWCDYFTQARTVPHADTAVKAIEILKQQRIAPSHAIDIGAGHGRDTIVMLEAGWSVLAIDNSSVGLSLLKTRAEKYATQLAIQKCLFEEMQLPQAMFINAGYALPFCQKEHFDEVWNKIIVALLPSGIFSGHFFGPEDTWSNRYMTHSENDLREHLFQNFKILSLTTRKGPGNSNEGEKYWHVYNVVAQKIK